MIKSILLTILAVLLVGAGAVCLIGWIAVDIRNIIDKERKEETREGEANP
jgi:hypothetical protein